MTKIGYFLLIGLFLVSACSTPRKYEYGNNLKRKIDQANQARKNAKQNHKNSKTIERFWDYDNETFYVSIPVSADLYQYYNDLKRSFDSRELGVNNNFKQFLQRRSDDSSLTSLARQLREICLQNKMDNNELAELAISFVQSLKYSELEELNITYQSQAPGYDARRIYRMPFQVLYDQTGVCLDKSILGVALLQELSFGAGLLILDKVDHAAIALSCPARYAFRAKSKLCYVESTSRYRIGAVPKDMRSALSTAKLSTFKDGREYSGKDLQYNYVD